VSIIINSSQWFNFFPSLASWKFLESGLCVYCSASKYLSCLSTAGQKYSSFGRTPVHFFMFSSFRAFGNPFPDLNIVPRRLGFIFANYSARETLV
jgi:hypothetical protein